MGTQAINTAPLGSIQAPRFTEKDGITYIVPGTPAAGLIYLYSKTDHLFYTKASDGNEHVLINGDSTQTLTNKTLGNTNTITLKDTLFTLQDDGDATKQARFQLSGITAGNTRTFTLHDVDETLLGSASQIITTLTTEQMRLRYDASNYVSWTVSSGGDLTIAPSGGDTGLTGTLTITGNADANQFVIRANGTQTAVIAAIQTSGGGANLWIVDAKGSFTLTPSTTSTEGGYAYSSTVTHDTARSNVYNTIATARLSHTSGTMSNGYGQFLQALYLGTSAASPAVTNLNGNLGRVGITGASPTGTITWGNGFLADSATNAGTGTPAVTFTGLAGFHANNMGAGNGSNGLTITNSYGIYLENQSGASTLSYAIFTNTGLVRLGDRLRIIGSADQIQLYVQANGTNTNDVFQVVTSAGATLVKTTLSGVTTLTGRDSGTNAVLNVLVASHDSSGTTAANFGTGIQLQGRRSTTDDTAMARWRSIFTDVTSSWTTKTILSAQDNGGERDVIYIGANGSTGLLSFFSVTTPIVQPTTGIAAATFVANTSGIANDTATFDGYTIGQLAKVIRNLGLAA